MSYSIERVHLKYILIYLYYKNYPYNYIILYYSLFYPYLINNIIIWGGVSFNKIERIQIKMNKTLRYILNVSYNANSPWAA